MNSQSEVDEFIIDYPNCTIINGRLRIGANPGSVTNITNLDALTNIEVINGNLNLQHNPSLISLEPLYGVVLNNLSTSLLRPHTVINSPLITSLDGLFSSNTILNGPGLEIATMHGLTSLTGLETITGIEGRLNISDNEQLENINALSNVTGEIGSIIIGDNPNLENLFGIEGITEITGTYSFFGRLLWIQGNDLLEDLSSFENLQSINESSEFEASYVIIEANPILQDITGLNDLNFTMIPNFNLSIQDNSNLSICNIESVCDLIANDENATISIENNNGFCEGIIDVINACNVNLNVINGEVKFDFNNDGCDTDDFTAQSILVETTDGTTTIGSFTNAQGAYQLLLDFEGEVTTAIVEDSLPDNYTATPVITTTEFVGFGNEAVVDFCLNATQTFNDLKITLIPTSAARPGFDSDYRMVYENVGSTTLDATVTFEFNPANQSFVNASPVESSIVGNLITWDFVDILPFQSGFIDVRLNHFTPPNNEIGDRRMYESNILLVEDEGDESPINNKSTLDQIYIGSFDPNDIQVVQGPEILEAQTGDFLDYIVRFQNTGTADAITVRVDHILDDNLDFATLRPLSSSHPYQAVIRNGNEVSFVFEDINLPPQEIDEEGSNGFIIFQVRPKNSFSLGDNVAATASIFFDFNEPIITNTVTTTVVDVLSVAEDRFRESDIKLYPNPVSDVLTIEVAPNISYTKMIVYSLLGEKVIETNETSINVESLSTGVYFVKLLTDSGISTKKIIKNR